MPLVRRLTFTSCYQNSQIKSSAGTTTFFRNEQYSANSIVDNNYTTFWMKNYGGPPAWITIELEEITNICKIRIAWLNTTLANFTVSVSKDGTVFHHIGSYLDSNTGRNYFAK
jgi:hypothetical protein